MCRDVVGKVTYFHPNHLIWKVEHFSDLIPKSRSRIWSPRMKFWVMELDPATPPLPASNRERHWTKLSIKVKNVSVDGSDPFNCIRVGLTDRTGNEIHIFECVWYRSCNAFVDYNCVNIEKLLIRRGGATAKGHLRLSCKVPIANFRHIFPAVEFQSGVQDASDSFTNSSSASIPMFSVAGSWTCQVCRITNLDKDLKCMFCQTPMSLTMNSATETLVTSKPSDICSSYNGSECNLCRFPSSSSESLCPSCGTPKSKRKKNYGLAKLSQCFRDMLKEEKDADLTIKVQGREFKVHRLILKARSSEFEAMLSNKQQNTGTERNMNKTRRQKQRNNENVIELEDFEPEVFEEFLLFIYSGKLENMTCDNVYGLYNAADTYNLPDLKCECIDFLKKNISLDNICEIIRLATNHKETELLNLAIDYFAMDMDAILTTSNWMMFLKDNPIAANELCIKALQLGFTKREDFSP